MEMPDELVRKQVFEGWKSFVDNLEKSLDLLEKEIEFTSKMVNACTLEWCEASERAIDDISNSLFSISEPSWLSEEDSRKLKALKRKVHDVYAKYKAAASKR
jgi:phage shock protein A